jgi:hypothetical protein
VKFYYLFIFFIFSQFAVFAQQDTMGVFHQAIASKSRNNGSFHKNALSTNLIQIVRGGALINYERIIGNSGLAINIGTGISKFDVLGQLYLRKIAHYYDSGFHVEKKGSQIKPMFDAGLKYYLNDEMGGTYCMLSFASITNTVNIEPFYSYDIDLVTQIKHNNSLNYRSNELKLLFGFTNDNSEVFYHDFCFGIGYRFIKYQSYFETPLYSTSYSLTINQYSVEERKNQTFWFFMSWKFGSRF